MKKEIRFSAKLDTSEFDRTVDALQRKLKDIYRGADQGRLSYQNQQRMGALGIGPGPSPADRQRNEAAEAKTRRETDVFIRQQVREQERLAKVLESQHERLKKLRQEQKEVLAGTQEELRLKEKIANIEGRIGQIRSSIGARGEAISSALDSRRFGIEDAGARLASIYGRHGMSGVMRALPTAGGMWARGLGPGGVAGIAGAAIGAAGSAISGGGQLVGGYMQLPAQITATQAAGQQVNNEIMRNVLRGGGYEQVFFGKERAKAVAEALQYTQGQRVQDIAGTVGGILKSIGIGVGAGAAAGAGLGALGMGVGAIPGAVVGGVIGGGRALWSGREEIMGQLGIGRYGQATQERYRTMQQQKMRELFDANKELDPIRKMMFEDFQENMMPNLMFQRGAGLSDVGMRNFYGDVTGRGFTRGMGRDMFQRILAAGGSTGSGLGATGTALEAERSYGLTNAAQVVGRLSGTMGSGMAAEKSLVAIFAAGTKQGLDDSKFAEEQRKFAEMTAQAIYATGASDAGSAAVIAERMASLIADRSGRGMEAAQTAAQFRTGIEKGAGGPGGTLEMGMFLSDSNLRNLDPTTMAALGSMSMEEIAALGPNNPLRQQILEDTGLTFPQFLERMQEGKRLKMSGQGPEMMGAMKTLQEVGDATDIDSMKRRTDAQGRLQAGLRARFGLDIPTIESLTKDITEGKITDLDKLMSEAEGRKGLEARETGRVGDEVIRQQGAMEGITNKLNTEFSGAIDTSVGKMGELTEAVDILIKKIKQAGERGDVKEVQTLTGQLTNLVVPGSQPQSTPPKPTSATRMLGD